MWVTRQMKRGGSCCLPLSGSAAVWKKVNDSACWVVASLCNMRSHSVWLLPAVWLYAML
jgi:hypothetical protein